MNRGFNSSFRREPFLSLSRPIQHQETADDVAGKVEDRCSDRQGTIANKLSSSLRKFRIRWRSQGEIEPGGFPHQQLIDEHLAKTGVRWQPGVVVNFLDTQIALVEADEGIAIIPSFGLPACRNREVVMSQLINPVVNLEFHQISNRGKKLPPGANEFTAFLKSYIARWAGRAGVL